MNNLGIRKKVLSQIFPDNFYQEGRHEFMTFCPNGCNNRKRKLQINLEKNLGQCWVCGESGHALYFVKKYGNYGLVKKYSKTINFYKDNKFEDHKTEVTYPEGYKFLLENLYQPLGKLSYKYLRNNLNLTDDTILQSRIGFCDSGRYYNRVIFPSYDEFGDLNYFVGRALDDSMYKKYLDCSYPKQKIVFNELFVQWRKPVIIVESIKTQLKHWGIKNIVPLNGSEVLTSSHKLVYNMIVNGTKKVYFGLDFEAYSKALESMKLLKALGIEVYKIKFVDQADEISTEKFMDYIRNSTPFDSMDYLKEKVLSL